MLRRSVRFESGIRESPSNPQLHLAGGQGPAAEISAGADIWAVAITSAREFYPSKLLFSNGLGVIHRVPLAGINVASSTVMSCASPVPELVDSLNAVIWEADPTTFQFTYVSRGAEALLGYSLEHWL